MRYYLFSLISIYVSFKFKPEIYMTRNFFTCFLLVLLKKKVILELHHDLDMEGRIVRFLVKKLKYINSKYILKIIAISHGVKEVYINKYSVNTNKILVLPSGSSIKKSLLLIIIKIFF